MIIEERASTHVYRQKRMFTKEELLERESLCVYEQPAYCVAECPLKLDTKAMIAAVASGDFTKARQLYEKITPFPNILSAGCEAPCEG
ncbi:MAG: aldehyde dehydrogenase, partial [Lachnospiraceae bacterium]|nr:aldehyde dehydrogenase [Lachnospiraceae bacterium]